MKSAFLPFFTPHILITKNLKLKEKKATRHDISQSDLFSYLYSEQ